MSLINTSTNNETHKGFCLEIRERSNFMDSYYSDYSMLVWNDEKSEPESVFYYCNRANSQDVIATVDAPPEVKTKYQDYLQRKLIESNQAYLTRVAMTPAKGKLLKVVKGRKVPHGTTGICIWIGNNGYGTSCGIKNDEGQVYWTALSNVEVVISMGGR